MFENDQVTDATTSIIQFCESALSDLSENNTALMTLNHVISPISLKSELGKCKRDATQLHSFGEIINTFCRIKFKVQSDTIDQLMTSEYIACFKDLDKYMTVKWVNELIMKDVKLIKEQFLLMTANLNPSVDQQAMPPAAIRQDRPQHYGGMRFD
ncbi:MAG: hypothetical protein GY737_10375, partial [Desulfobacteraceae bacterium]|nr:hypothetical protein [Desulfobacteraceae bacterium]